MTRPVIDDFRAFTPERLLEIRSRRLIDLVPGQVRTKGKTKPPKTPRLGTQAKQVIAGLDPATQAILQKIMMEKP